MGRGIAALADMTRDYGTAVSYWPDYDGMTYRQFWNSYPDDFEDENNLSLVTVMRWPGYNCDIGFSILYAGDMERAGWQALLRREDFRAEMRDISVFVASHHGRLNGYCRELFEWTDLEPELFVISDCGIQYATQETIALYRRHASGVGHNGQFRRVITTRRDGYVRFRIGPDGASLWTAR